MTRSKFLTPVDLADRWQMSVGTLANWRARGTGPSWSQIGGKILYPMDAVEEYEKDSFRASAASAAKRIDDINEKKDKTTP